MSDRNIVAPSALLTGISKRVRRTSLRELSTFELLKHKEGLHRLARGRELQARAVEDVLANWSDSPLPEEGLPEVFRGFPAADLVRMVRTAKTNELHALRNQVSSDERLVREVDEAIVARVSAIKRAVLHGRVDPAIVELATTHVGGDAERGLDPLGALIVDECLTRVVRHGSVPNPEELLHTIRSRSSLLHSFRAAFPESDWTAGLNFSAPS